MKARFIVIACGLFLTCVGGVNAEEERWLGIHRGANMPGFEIGKTQLIVSEFSGPQHDGAYDEMLDHMKIICLKYRGVALVNVTLTPAIGDVRGSASSGQAKVISPGLHIVGLADCVVKVEKVTP